MTSVLPGSVDLIFNNEEQITQHIYKKIVSNTNKLIGSEWEFFFLDEHNRAISHKGFQETINAFKRTFNARGYPASLIQECSDGICTNIGLIIEGIGTIIPEAGQQIEFSTIPCNSIEELTEKNKIAYNAIIAVAKQTGHKAVFLGYLPGYVNTAETMKRSRSIQWADYYKKRFPEQELTLKQMQHGTASIQFTFDSGGRKFHELFKTLLLLEPLFSIYYSNSKRSHFAVTTYAEMIPSQVQPIACAWDAYNTEDSIRMIVERLMDIEVPFIPDQENPCLYKAEPFIDSKPPSVRTLMKSGRLTEKLLNNVTGFMYTRPALRNITLGLIEMRGMDTQGSPEKIGEIASLILPLLYNDSQREALLSYYSIMSVEDIEHLHEISLLEDKQMAMRSYVCGMRVSDIFEDIVKRSRIAATTEKTAHNVQVA